MQIYSLKLLLVLIDTNTTPTIDQEQARLVSQEFAVIDEDL